MQLYGYERRLKRYWFIVGFVVGVAFGVGVLASLGCSTYYPSGEPLRTTMPVDAEYRQWRPHLYASVMLDVATTKYLIDHGGIEANPLVQWTMDRGDLVFVGVQLALAYWVDWSVRRDCEHAMNDVKCVAPMKWVVWARYIVGAWNIGQITRVD